MNRKAIIRSIIVGCALLIAGVAALWAVTPRSEGIDVRLVENSENSARMGTPAPGAGQHAVTVTGPLCLKQPGSVVIKRVEPIGARGGFSVVAFAFVPAEVEVPAGAPGRLSDFVEIPKIVKTSQTCGADESVEPLVLEVLKPRAEDASARAFEVFYTGGGKERSVVIHWGLKLCEDPGSATTFCALPD